MAAFPEFLTSEIEPLVEKIYRPNPPRRRGELIAWASAVALGIMNVVLYRLEERFQIFALILFLFFALAALLISFGNWMDANTNIYIDSKRVHFSSPLRNVNLEGNSIEELWTEKTGKAWRVAVFGRGKYFTFSTESELRGGSNHAMRIGIVGGEQLARMIRELGRLSAPVAERDAWVCRKSSS
jgi:hypothetical protein